MIRNTRCRWERDRKGHTGVHSSSSLKCPSPDFQETRPFCEQLSLYQVSVQFCQNVLHLLIILIPEYVYHFFSFWKIRENILNLIWKKKNLIELNLVNEFCNVLNRFLHGMHYFILFLSEVLFSLMKICYINVQYVKIKFTSILTL